MGILRSSCNGNNKNKKNKKYRLFHCVCFLSHYLFKRILFLVKNLKLKITKIPGFGEACRKLNLK